MSVTSCHVLDAYYALIVAGIVFGVLAVMHILRLSYHAKTILGDRVVPQWVSVAFFMFFLLLSLWMFKVSIW